MIRTFTTTAVCIALTVAAAGAVIAAQQRVGAPAEARLAAAQHYAEVEGDLKKAIELCREVVDDKSAPRPVVAAALLQMAGAYERLGRSEARPTYQRIVKEFPDQPVVAAARAKLAVHEPRAQAGLSPRQWEGDGEIPHAFSPDGRQGLIVTQDLADSRLLIRDMSSGQSRVVVPRTDSGRAMNGRFSRDGRYIAYGWLEYGSPQKSGLRVIGTAPGAVARTLIEPQPSSPLSIVDWSNDGTSILVFFGGQAMKFAWISASDGAERTIKTFDRWRTAQPGGAGRGSLSPDGSTIVFPAIGQEGSSDWYLYTIDSNGQNETAIVKMAGRNTRPVWTPDGGHVLFVNSPTAAERPSLWSIAVRAGTAVEEPRLVQSNFTGGIVDMTRNGELFYSVDAGASFAEFVAVKAPGGMRVIQAFKGLGGTWCGDNSLAFLREAGPVRNLIVRTASGDERTYVYDGLGAVTPRCMPGSKSLLVYVAPKGDAAGTFHRVNLATGAFAPAFALPSAGGVHSPWGPLSADGKTLYLPVRKSASDPWDAIHAVDVATGGSVLAARIPATRSAPALAISPDGGTLAVALQTEGAGITPTSASKLFTVRTNGSDLRELHGPFAGHSSPDRVRWTPDGRHILFVTDTPTAKTPSGVAAGWRIMRIEAAGGKPEYTGLDSLELVGEVPIPRLNGGNLLGSLDVSPDGTRIAFSARTVFMSELWTLDNVWNVVRAAK